MNQIIEKNREFNVPTLLAFLDYEEVFEKVIRTKLANYD
jgi:hypothetical protein